MWFACAFVFASWINGPGETSALTISFTPEGQFEDAAAYCNFAEFVNCQGRQIRVGAGEKVSHLATAARMAMPGDTIVIAQGSYKISEIKLDKDLAIRGEGEVVLTAEKAVSKGLLVTGPGVSLLIDNLILQGAKSPDRNGAGVRHQGSNLMVYNTTFRQNENGILATADGTGNLRIERSRFLNNGFGDGYSHGIYVQNIREFAISDSRFVGTRVGHHIKSMARSTLIQTSIFDDADGRTSYSIEVAAGGTLKVNNCQFTRKSNAGNAAIIFYSINRGGLPGDIFITSNRITNEMTGAVFLRNQTESIAVMENNQIYNKGFGRVRLHTGSASVDGREKSASPR